MIAPIRITSQKCPYIGDVLLLEAIRGIFHCYSDKDISQKLFENVIFTSHFGVVSFIGGTTVLIWVILYMYVWFNGWFVTKTLPKPCPQGIASLYIHVYSTRGGRGYLSKFWWGLSA